MTELRIRARGRGALTNESGRFESQSRAVYDDGWDDAALAPRQVATTITEETPRSIISWNESPDLPFDRTINPYRGCEHGCIYCYARPTHAYLGHSPGLDFETILYSKPNAAEVLTRELSKPSYVADRLQLGANTDPYQPIEKDLRITRQIVEVLSKFNHPTGITTKNALVTRDIDLLAPMAQKGLVMVAMSVTSLDRKLSRSMEPRASTPDKRFEAIRLLSEAGIPVIAGVAPIIPGLNDSELERIMERAAEMGAKHAYYSTLRLPREVRDLFNQWLEAEQPNRAKRVMGLVRTMNHGKDYDPNWATRMKGDGPIADILKMRFKLARQKLGLKKIEPLVTTLFRPPPKAGDQLALF